MPGSVSHSCAARHSYHLRDASGIANALSRWAKSPIDPSYWPSSSKDSKAW